MTPESIVVSLDYAKRLKEAGWPQYRGEVFGWFEDASGDWSVCVVESFPEDDHIAAPTAEEILRRLPSAVISFLPFEKSPWMVMVNEAGHDVCETTLANAAAACYCYLAENKLLPPLP